MDVHRMLLILLLIFLEFAWEVVECNKHAKRLYGELLRKSGYNRIIRPVNNASNPIEVKIGLRLSQVIDVDEQNQIMTTNVWVQMEWTDPSLNWRPDEYGNVSLIYVPADDIWHPDIVLYNTGDGAYEMTEGTKATLSYNGVVKWKPPATFKSSCSIDVTFFPFDEQKCEMWFGSWTYNIHEVQITHLWQEKLGLQEFDELPTGMDLHGFYRSVEWAIIGVPAVKGIHHYAGSIEPFPKWTFTIHMKRKFLFYTVNLIIPLVSHALITVVVFYLPSDSKEKIALSINILLSLTVFFLMLSEIIPPTSMVVPLLGKYLVFTLMLVTLSVMVTVVTYNVHFRSSATHTMSDWTRKIFLYYLPRVLMMRRPKIENAHDVELKYIELKLCRCFRSSSDFSHSTSPYQFGSKRTKTQSELTHLSNELEQSISFETSEFCPEVQKAIDGAIFIANHLKHEDESGRTKEDWKYVALVIDRLFLWIYMAVCVFGTIGIICHAPMLYDHRPSITNDTD